MLECNEGDRMRSMLMLLWKKPTSEEKLRRTLGSWALHFTSLKRCEVGLV